VLVFGFHPVREALRTRPQSVVRVLVAGQAHSRRGREIEGLCERHDVPVERSSRRALDELTGNAVHNGFGAEVTVSKRPAAAADEELVVLVEDIVDPRNLGAVLRVCDGAGVGRVLIRDRGSAPLSAAAVKTAAGAIHDLAIERVTNSAQEIEKLKKLGYWVYGAAAEGRPPWELDLAGKACLVLGGEEKGLRARTRSLCDALVGLPMRGRIESLNVATAAAALLYEMVRQRSQGGRDRQSAT
jgi:23S rRNA (guanosine2251-2'-O)-methyltransferase